MRRAAVLEGLGSWAPPTIVTNDDLAEYLDTSDEWIRARTGIGQRHVSSPDISTLDLAVEAGSRAIKSAGGGEIDAVILATMSPDRPCPGTAPSVASQLGLGHAAAFDVAAVCSGFVYGAAAGAGLIAAGIAERVLVIGAEAMTRFIDPTDRTTAVIFGDGAGAIVMRAGEPDEPGAFGPFDLGSDGEGADCIAVNAGGSRLPASHVTVDARAHFMTMDGREVYRQSIPRMADSAAAVLAKAGWTIDDVDCLVAHQANSRIIDAVGRRLGLAPERCAINIDRYGNTAAATIPMALADAALSPGDRVLITAFGGGFTWGSTVLTWPELRPEA